mgnify:CR=1 FL=1
MPHLHIEPGNHDLTVSAYIINVEDPETPKLLLHQHKRLRKLMQPGGHVELNETPWDAITHEILEETGYDLADLILLDTPGGLNIKTSNHSVNIQPVPFFLNTHPMDNGAISHFHTDLSYAFVAPAAPTHPVQGEESTVFRLVALDEIDAIPTEEITSTAQTVGRVVLEAYRDGKLVPVEKP